MIITLCGSTRFKKAFQEWNARLTLQNNIILSVAMWRHSDQFEPTPEQKLHLDQIHFEKIELSDEIFVLDVGGYIGKSTRNEINHAKRLGKRVRYLTEDYPGWTEEDCLYVR